MKELNGWKRTAIAALCVAGLVAIGGASAATSQTLKSREPAFYESGNAFLRTCDSDSVYMLSQSRAIRETTSLVCTFWVVGVLQGLQAEDNLRPEHVVTPAEAAAATKYQELLAKQFGILPDFSMPSGNLCIPDAATNEQYKLVVIAYMKAHPTLLDQHAAYLAIAAFKTAWACKASSTK